MEAIRKFRRAIGPESETLIMVGAGFAVVLALMYFTPKEGWPVLVLPLVGWAFALIMVFALVWRGHWRRALEHPLEMILRIIGFVLMLGGLTLNGWAEFTGGQGDPSNSIALTGMLLTVVTDIVSGVVAQRRRGN